jgi:hypothetical protein
MPVGAVLPRCRGLTSRFSDLAPLQRALATAAVIRTLNAADSLEPHGIGARLRRCDAFLRNNSVRYQKVIVAAV